MHVANTFDPCIIVDSVDQCVGSFVSVRVRQAAGASPGTYNNLVINPTLEFNVDLEWQLDGSMTGPGNVLMILAGIDPLEWRVYIYAEKMGPGADLRIYEVAAADRPVIDRTPANVPVRYQHTATIPAGMFPETEPPGLQSGVYRLVTVVWANSNPPAGTPDICGFHEGPMIMAENPE